MVLLIKAFYYVSDPWFWFLQVLMFLFWFPFNSTLFFGTFDVKATCWKERVLNSPSPPSGGGRRRGRTRKILNLPTIRFCRAFSSCFSSLTETHNLNECSFESLRSLRIYYPFIHQVHPPTPCPPPLRPIFQVILSEKTWPWRFINWRYIFDEGRGAG